MGIETDEILQRILAEEAEKKAKIASTLAKVHDQNAAAAKAAGMTLDEWHEEMSRIGNKSNVDVEPEKVMTSAEYVLGYLFPTAKKSK